MQWPTLADMTKATTACMVHTSINDPAPDYLSSEMLTKYSTYRATTAALFVLNDGLREIFCLPSLITLNPGVVK